VEKETDAPGQSMILESPNSILFPFLIVVPRYYIG